MTKKNYYVHVFRVKNEKLGAFFEGKWGIEQVKDEVWIYNDRTNPEMSTVMRERVHIRFYRDKARMRLVQDVFKCYTETCLEDIIGEEIIVRIQKDVEYFKKFVSHLFSLARDNRRTAWSVAMRYLEDELRYREWEKFEKPDISKLEREEESEEREWGKNVELELIVNEAEKEGLMYEARDSVP